MDRTFTTTGISVNVFINLDCHHLYSIKRILSRNAGVSPRYKLKETRF